MSAQTQQVPKTAIIEFDEFAGKLAEFKIRYDGIVYDLTVPEQEKKARSDRFSIGKVISRLDEAHKALKAPLKEKVDLLDGERKRIKDDLLAVQDKIKSQIETHEAKIAAHEEGLQARVDEIRLLALFQDDLTSMPFTPDSAEVNRRLSILAKIEVDDTFEHRKADGTLAQVEVVKRLNTLLAERLKAEQEQIELERLRKEAADRDRANREEQIRQEATAKAEAKAKEQAEQAKIAQERAEERIKAAEAQAKAAKETAEREAIAAQERAKQEQVEAVARAEQQKMAQFAREQAENEFKAEKERKAEEARVAKKSHRAKVEKETIEALIYHLEFAEDLAEIVTETIRDGKIAHVRIEYGCYD